MKAKKGQGWVVILWVCIALVLGCTPATAGVFFTTEVDCVTKENHFLDAQEVYIQGSQASDGVLDDGLYYVQVTNPSGSVLLGSSGNVTPVQVVGGNFVQCYKLWDIVLKASDGTQGYDPTTNAGGNYKVWISQDPLFTSNVSHITVFKVRPVDTPLTDICVVKYYDADYDQDFDQIANGDEVDELPIPDWRIELWLGDELVECALTDVEGKATFTVPSDGAQYIVREVLPVYTLEEMLTIGFYINSTPLEVEVTAALDEDERISVEFGNVSLIPEYGLGRTPGFWQTRTLKGRATLAYNILLGWDPEWRDLLNTMCLVLPDGTDLMIPDTIADNGIPDGDYEAAFAKLDRWIVSMGADGNMAYILSRQLAALALNRNCGFLVDPALMWVLDTREDPPVPVLIDDFLGDANGLLCGNPLTLGGDPAVAEVRDQQEAIKDVIDAINNNVLPVFVISPVPLPFTPLLCE